MLPYTKIVLANHMISSPMSPAHRLAPHVMLPPNPFRTAFPRPPLAPGQSIQYVGAGRTNLKIASGTTSAHLEIASD
jgi:hypothetical protein